MGVFTITLVRHGETQANKDRVIQGQQDTELSERGLQQAHLAGIRLQQEQFTDVFSSDLRRAHRTCELILEKNTTYLKNNFSIVKDPRLRERKFGIFEGRPSVDFQTAARKFRKSSASSEDFPPGGETVKQLRARARAFFTDLYETLAALDPESGTLASSKWRHHTGSACSDVFPTDGASTETPTTSTTLGLRIKSSSTSSTDSKLSPAGKDSGHSSSGSTSSGCESFPAPGGSLPELHPLPGLSHRDDDDDEGLPDVSPSSGSGSSVEDDNVLSVVFDTDVHSIPCNQRAIQYGCPNVSLSPIFEHRLSSLSSMSSGRNNSFDDGDDSVPAMVADVLIVSHGGWLQQLINIFVDELGCKIPGGKKYALQVSPNTGLSKFTCTLDPTSKTPSITCLYIHDKDHLISLEAAGENSQGAAY